ncbi:MAG: hypothetical protein COZ46_01250 [Verrucomicrobia bacterium CG_4_10_14_3_um_filter_43_23]|nr:MAG: hypothetical protein AUJ82_01285 [Verrucomicrobia bacterium CG1_02_43_26]PIP59530.1 MAG: hypothetical protein COX01_02855 [Verrucomicrobia bacterium CG22_combo_CG10-13_8_21_14_all_43_17]PIX58831.1 MAG: hypothetical protein COZ46_01250 [Verrucomicrobia bacterium CG_4_10_14_3_um_filter_43_23]PIY60926.1 MAG: hypothetical protein COY94_07930 [Verrucomicrobia bacterium CG_4_10_14_0_8_um_filter_43_34]PJA44840.1 MAG: hypothetical protein CO175_00740 [Verrucomicrobia bacterium CG_4_9_14_3_um_fi
MEELPKETLLLLAYLYLRHSKHEKAMHLLLALKRLYPEDAHVSRSLSYAYWSVGKYEPALLQAEASLEPNMPFEHEFASKTLIFKSLWGMKREEEARKVMLELIEKKKAHKARKIEAEKKEEK